MEKNPHLGPDLSPLGPNSAHKFFSFFFFKNLVSSVTRYNGQLASCKMSEKTNDAILRKFRSRRMHGLTRLFSQDAVWLTSSIQKLLRKEKESQSFHVAIVHKKNAKNSFNGLAKLIIKNSWGIINIKKTNIELQIWKYKVQLKPFLPSLLWFVEWGGIFFAG